MGSIPACAGEPDRQSRPNVQRGVYPRVCGGTQKQRLHVAYKHGLSPRVRGNQVEQLLALERVGSIPACAGEPYPARRRQRH